MLLQPEARRGLLILSLVLTFGVWFVVRCIRAIVSRIAKGVMIDLLQDDKAMKLTSKRFAESMTAANREPAFRDSMVGVLWSSGCVRSIKTVFSELLVDDHFVKGAASLIRSLTAIDNLKDAVRGQIRETLKDQNIHRALFEGSIEALKPDWMHRMRNEKENPASPQVPQAASPILLGRSQ
jgi:hypothetical protein